MYGRKASKIPLDTRHAIIKLFQAGNSQMKISRDLAISRTTIQSIIYKFQQTNSVENTGQRQKIKMDDSRYQFVVAASKIETEAII